MESAGVKKPSDFSTSRFIKTVVLKDWWLFKSQTECEGKCLVVSGVPDDELAVRVFISAPVAKRHSVTTLETSDGTFVILRGFINRPRTEEAGFSPEVFKYFLFGFPLNWEEYAGKKLSDDDCPHPVSSPRKTTPLSCGATVDAKKTSENSPTREASVNKSATSNVGASSDVKDMKEKLKTFENDPAAEVIDVVKAILTANKSKNVKAIPTAKKPSNNIPSGEAIDVSKAMPTAKKSKSDSISAKSKDGASSGVKDVKEKLKTSENVPAAEAIDVVKSIPTAKKSKNVDNFTRSNVGATSDAKVMKEKSKTLENVPATEAIGVVKPTQTAKKFKKVGKYTKSNMGETSIKVIKTILKTSENVPTAHGINGTTTKNSKSVINFLKNNVDATSGVKDMKTKLTFDDDASPSIQEGLKSPSATPSDFSSLKKSRSGRLLLHPLEFWRNQKAVYDSSRKITGIVDGTPDSVEARGTRKKSLVLASGTSKKRKPNGGRV